MNSRRRSLLAAGAASLLGSTAGLLATSGTRTAHAQANRKSRIVFRVPGTPKDESDFDFHFAKRLAAQLAGFGWVEGRDFAITSQYLGDKSEVLTDHLAEIRNLKPDVIVSVNAPATLALRDAVADIPIVAWALEEPVGAGLAKSITRPGGNVTGLTQGKDGVYPKQVDFLRKAVRGLSGIAVMGYRGEGVSADVRRQFEALEAVIRGAGLKHVSVPTVGPRALEALPILRGQGVQAGIYFHNPAPRGRDTQRAHAVAAIRHRIAVLGYFANLADDGFLASYGELDSDLFRRLAQQVDRILRGGNPAEIPFMGPQRFHLRVNARTAAALGIPLSPDIRIMADEVIE